MRFSKSGVISTSLLLTIAFPALASPRVHRGPTAPRPTKHIAPAAKSKPAGPRAIDSERATQIQTALIKNGYLTGTPTGVWDAQSEAAMQKLQADNGWQTKLVPDARAIIKLGLGPSTPAATASTAPESAASGQSRPEAAVSVTPNTP